MSIGLVTSPVDKLELLEVEIGSVQPEILCQFISFLYKNQVKFQKQEEEDSATENALQIFETANYTNFKKKIRTNFTIKKSKYKYFLIFKKKESQISARSF